MGDDIVSKVRKAGEIQNDPALIALQELNDTVSSSFEVLQADIEKGRKETNVLVDAVQKDVERTRTEMAAGFKAHADRINTLDRRSIALGIGGARDVEGLCLAALGDEEKKDIAALDWMIPRAQRNRAESPILSNPVGATLVAHWLHKSLLVQKRKYSSKDHENALYADLARYEKALYDAFPHMQKAAALTTGTDTLGGHWIPDPVAAELYRLVLDNSVLGGLATHVPMNTKTLDLPVEGSSALSVSWGSENTQITDSVPASNATNKLTLTASRLNGRAQSSMEEIQDSPISVLQWVQAKLTELAGREIDQELLEGTTFTGLLTASGVNEASTGANGDAITYATLVDLVYRARERASREGARFFLAPETMAKIVGLVDSQGAPIVQFGNVPNAVSASILGYPVEVHSAIVADRTYGTGTTLSHIYFGPPRQMVVGDRVGMAWDVSDQPNFDKYMVDMRLVMRIALGVAVPKAFSRKLFVDV